MKVSFIPGTAAHGPGARGPQAQTSSTPPPSGTSEDGVEISLSKAAKQILEGGDGEYTGNSPAHQARQALAAGTVAFAAGDDASTTPFGQIVKTFAPGHNTAAPGPQEPEAPAEGGGTGEVAEDNADAGEIGDPDGTGEADGTSVVEGPDASGGTDGEADPSLSAGEPETSEILDGSAAAGDDTTEPGSALAGSGDAVAEAGEASDPVPVVDAGALSDELLEALDEGSEGAAA